MGWDGGEAVISVEASRGELSPIKITKRPSGGKEEKDLKQEK